MGEIPPAPLKAPAADLLGGWRLLPGVGEVQPLGLGDHLHVALGLLRVVLGAQALEVLVSVPAAERQGDDVVNLQAGCDLAAGIAALVAVAGDDPGPAGRGHAASVDFDGLGGQRGVDAAPAARGEACSALPAPWPSKCFSTIPCSAQ